MSKQLLLTNKYLINDHPILILPKLACMVGVNESMFLQQLHYWLIINESKNINFINGHYWSYYSLPEWNKQFPFWHESTLRRTIQSLKKQGLLLTDRMGKDHRDRTLWYSINYEKLNRKTREFDQQTQNNRNDKMTDGSVQNDQMDKMTDGSVQNDQMGSVQNDQMGSVQNDQMYNKEQKLIKETKKETNSHISFFSDLEPDSEPPTENPPLLVKPEIKAEDQPNSGNQISEADHDLSVTSGKQDPPLPPPRRDECKTGTDEDLRFDRKIPFPGDINNSCYGQELARRRFDLPEEIARGTDVVLKDKFGRHLLCMLNAEGLDPIANLPNFLKYYHAQHLIGHPLYKDKPFGDVIQSMTARAITSKIKDDDTGVLIQTILDFKKKIAKAAQPTLQPRSLEPLPEKGNYTLPDMSSFFEASKKRHEELIKQQREKNTPKTAATRKKEVSTVLDPLLTSKANLTPNPTTSTPYDDF